ncbi:CYTH domain-containing protein [Halomonas llamarensis]|uniref:CYTH domain-containing protein n=1 Tax=Halomonas llamarensis TaxID=2945104 RepID=A0ABT0SQX4_9GAMM|nr:CYTH domain-containing protein [Halomonas llamarensis]MCL7930203.1 CYTH domain-containing protein [Halomonas llamarensis]
MKNPKVSAQAPTEVELKLALAPGGPAQLAAHPLLDTATATRLTLTNTYFDTPDGALNAARVALRLRQINGQTLQTVKTAGQGGGGLSSREEWEWEVNGNQLDIAGLKTLPPFQSLDDATLATLVPQLRTDFTRTKWDIHHQESQIELALDEGDIDCHGYRAPIREMELELKSGTPNALWALATTLAADVALRPSDSSKAARGAALGRQHWPLPEAHTPSEWFHRATLALDAFHDSGQGTFLTLAFEALATLAAHPTLNDSARPLAQTLPQALDANGQPRTAYGSAALTLARALANPTDLL